MQIPIRAYAFKLRGGVNFYISLSNFRFFDKKLSLTKYSVQRLRLRTILSKFKGIEESNLHVV